MKQLTVALIIILLAACSTLGPTTPTPLASPVTPSTTVPSVAATPTGPTPTITQSSSPESEEKVTATQEPVIVFSQEGGFAGIQNIWLIYADGRVEAPEGREFQLAPATVESLLTEIEEIGFFDLNQPKQADICCDRFTYTLLVRHGGQENEISFTEGDPNLAETYYKANEVVLSVIENFGKP